MILAKLNSMLIFDVNDLMLSSGKIYVVIGVMLIIFIGLIIYLAWIDRKVKKIEDELKNNMK